MPNGFIIVDRDCANILTVVEAAEPDPYASTMTSYRIQLLSNSQFVNQSRRIHANANTGSYLLVLCRLLVYIDLD